MIQKQPTARTKLTIALAAALVCPGVSFAQGPPKLEWQGYFSDQSDFGRDFVQKENGHLLVAATATNWNTVEPRILLFEVNRAGEEVWRTYVGESNSKIRRIVRHSDGGFLLFGYVTSAIGNGQIAKVDSLGVIQWTKTVPGVSIGDLGLVLPSSGEIVFGVNSGSATGIPPTSIPGLIYLSENGDSLRSTSYEDEQGFWIGTLVTSPANGGIVLAGFQATLQDRWGHVLKVDDDGAREWSLTFGGGYIEHLDDIVEDPDGNYVVTGVGHTQAGGGDLYAAKISATGELIWELYAGGPGRDEGSAVTVDGDGGYVFTGETEAGEASERLYLVKANAGGEILWEVVSDAPNSSGEAIQLDSEDNYFIVGWAQGPVDPSDVFVAKYRPSTVTDVEPVALKSGNPLSVFPNPAAGRFTLDYKPDTPGLKQIELFDTQGRVVLNRFEWMGAAGRTRVDLDDPGIRSGVHFLRVSDGDRQLTTPIMVISEP